MSNLEPQKRANPDTSHDGTEPPTKVQAVANPSTQRQDAPQASPQAPIESRLVDMSEIKTIIDYLKTLTPVEREELYKDQFTVMAVFRCLPPVSKQLVLRMLLLGDFAITTALLRSWRYNHGDVVTPASKECEASFTDAVQRMHQLGVIVKSELKTPLDPQNPTPVSTAPRARPEKIKYGIRLEANFQQCLLSSLSAPSFGTAGFDEYRDPTAKTPTATTTEQTEANEQNTPVSGATPLPKKINTRPASALAQYAEIRWSILLHFLVGIPHPSGLPSPLTQKIVIQLGLLKTASPSDNARLAINPGPPVLSQSSSTTSTSSTNTSSPGYVLSPRGVQFLFTQRHHQVWKLVLHLLGALPDSSSQLDALQILFRLSFMPIGYSYPTTLLTPAQNSIVTVLSDIGVIFRHSPSSKNIYPTQLILHLSGVVDAFISTDPNSKISPAVTDNRDTKTTTEGSSTGRILPKIEENQRFVVVETSFKIYAFSREPLKIVQLSFLADLEYRLPNMVVARITRRSFRRALLNGLSSQDVVSWLQLHSHNRTVTELMQDASLGLGGQGNANRTSTMPSTSTYGVPNNVIAQLQIWEKERERLAVQSAYLIKEFDRATDFDNWRVFTQKNLTLLHADPERQILVVSPEGLRSIQAERKRLQVANAGY